MRKFDLAVIGSGPGGYVAAIWAAKKGMNVVSIEKEKTLGGTCLNVGCIPSKALLHTSEMYDKLSKEGKKWGIECSNLSFDLTQMMKRKEQVVAGFVQGIDFLYKKNKVTSIFGRAKLISEHVIEIEGQESIEADSIILATGSEPIALPFLPFDEEKVLSSTGALSLKKVPKEMVIVGGGIIGLELGSVYLRLGCKVTVVEMLDRLCAGNDEDISKAIHNIFQKQGMTFHLSSKVLDGKKDEHGVSLTIQNAAGEKTTLHSEVVLVAVGRKPYSQDLNVNKDSSGRVIVDSNFRTSIPHVYAIGDLIDGPQLAHKASEEGMACVDIIKGEHPHVNYLAIPNVMYTSPEVATVGLTEAQAKESHLEIKTGTFPFMANSRARTSGDTQGFVKIIGEKNSDRCIGLHIIGAHASEMIGEGVMAIQKKMTLHEIAMASHAHPAYSEAIKEAALGAEHKAIHI